jgi:hypothetical protein
MTAETGARRASFPRTGNNLPVEERSRMTRGRRTLLLLAAALALGLAALAALTGCASCSRPTAPASAPKPKPAPPQPAAFWPLLGTPAPSAGAIRVRVVSVKVENEKPARPQSGLAQADVVYETVIEGGDTRYNALYQSRAPTKVGPVRSARLSDTYIVPQYHAVFGRIGADYVVETAIKQTPNMDDLNEFHTPAPYTRSSARRAPHNLYTSIPALRRAAVAKGFPAAADAPGLAFGALPAATSETATAIGIPLSAVAHAQWTWLPSAKRYARAFNGSRAGDAGTKTPYEASNVVVLFAQTVRTKALDPAGNPTFEQILGGTGKAVVFRDGRRFDGSWSAGKDAPPVLRANDGSALALSPGVTWFEVVPTDGTVTSR